MIWRQLRSFAIFDHLLVAGMAVMSLLVFTNVVLRYVFNSGLPFSVEVSRLVFVWIVFLGSIVALRDGSHLKVETIVKMLPRPAAYACFFVTHAIMLWCCWLLWQGSWIQTRVNLTNYSPISGISVGFLYGVGLVTAVAFALILAVRIWRALNGTLPQDHDDGLLADATAANDGSGPRDGAK
ncbi:MAG: TRAP transporter small permease [Hoeflea sp.]|uniref:TRAP transporter small permease n=1 Tax=Hoeflea sp. TaxID=1940281 RepID=UPI0032EB36B1